MSAPPLETRGPYECKNEYSPQNLAHVRAARTPPRTDPPRRTAVRAPALGGRYAEPGVESCSTVSSNVVTADSPRAGSVRAVPAA